MFCTKCGTKNDDTAEVCQNCGNPLGVGKKQQAAAAEPLNDTAPTQPFYPPEPSEFAQEPPEDIDKDPPLKKKSRAKLIVLISVIFLFLIGAGIGGYFTFHSQMQVRQYTDQVNLGQKYLKEQNYDEAIIAFTKAIEIDPNRVEAYLGLADAYIGRKDYETAISVLEKGYAKTGSMQIKAKLDQIKALWQKLAYTITVDGVDAANYPNITATVKITSRSKDGELPDNLTGDFSVKEKDASVSCTSSRDSSNIYKVSFTTKTTDRQRIGLPFTVKATINHADFTADGTFTPPPMENTDISVEQVDVSEYPTIKLYLDLSDKKTGNTPDNLPQSMFYLSEKKAGGNDYEDVKIKKVAQLNESENLNIEMVADISSSMEGASLLSAQNVMNAFLNNVQFNIGDKVELLAFNDVITPEVSFSNSKQAVSKAINGLVTNGDTNLYDALEEGIRRSAAQNGAKCVIAFTDGEDNGSTSTPQDVIDLSKKYSIPVFLISIGGYANTNMQNIAQQTGGFYQNVDQIVDMQDIYNRIYRQQKELYLLEYDAPAADSTSEQRQIRVELQSGDRGGTFKYQYTPSQIKP